MPRVRSVEITSVSYQSDWWWSLNHHLVSGPVWWLFEFKVVRRYIKWTRWTRVHRIICHQLFWLLLPELGILCGLVPSLQGARIYDIPRFVGKLVPNDFELWLWRLISRCISDWHLGYLPIPLWGLWIHQVSQRLRQLALRKNSVPKPPERLRSILRFTRFPHLLRLLLLINTTRIRFCLKQ